MNRFTGIAVVCLAVLVVLAGLYVAGYWWWVRPYCLAGNYYFSDTPAGHTFGILYAPVFQYEGYEVRYALEPAAP